MQVCMGTCVRGASRTGLCWSVIFDNLFDLLDDDVVETFRVLEEDPARLVKKSLRSAREGKREAHQ